MKYKVERQREDRRRPDEIETQDTREGKDKIINRKIIIIPTDGRCAGAIVGWFYNSPSVSSSLVSFCSLLVLSLLPIQILLFY